MYHNVILSTCILENRQCFVKQTEDSGSDSSFFDNLQPSKDSVYRNVAFPDDLQPSKSSIYRNVGFFDNLQPSEDSINRNVVFLDNLPPSKGSIYHGNVELLGSRLKSKVFFNSFGKYQI